MMNIKKSLCWLFALCLFCQGLVQAQTFAIPFSLTQSSPAIVFSLDSYGILMSTGTENGTAVLSAGEQGAGTRLLWYPGKAAFRAGNVSGTNWNDSNIGAYSSAFGQDTIASGSNSFATGLGSTASNSEAFAAGTSTASGYCSTAMGGAYAIGFYSAAFGDGASASGFGSLAAGIGSSASSTSSLAMGFATSAGGTSSAAFNYETKAPAYASAAFGQYNLGLSSAGATPNATSWLATDPLFEIGNGLPVRRQMRWWSIRMAMQCSLHPLALQVALLVRQSL